MKPFEDVIKDLRDKRFASAAVKSVIRSLYDEIELLTEPTEPVKEIDDIMAMIDSYTYAVNSNVTHSDIEKAIRGLVNNISQDH